MKYKDFNVGDSVIVTMPMGSGFEHPQRARVIEKGADGVVLFEKDNGRRWWANSRRIKTTILKYMTPEERRDFWERHAEAHRQMEEDFNALSPEQKLEVWKKKEEAHDLIRNAKLIKRGANP